MRIAASLRAAKRGESWPAGQFGGVPPESVVQRREKRKQEASLSSQSTCVAQES